MGGATCGEGDCDPNRKAGETCHGHFMKTFCRRQCGLCSDAEGCPWFEATSGEDGVLLCVDGTRLVGAFYIAFNVYGDRQKRCYIAFSVCVYICMHVQPFSGLVVYHDKNGQHSATDAAQKRTSDGTAAKITEAGLLVRETFRLCAAIRCSVTMTTAAGSVPLFTVKCPRSISLSVENTTRECVLCASSHPELHLLTLSSFGAHHSVLSIFMSISPLLVV